MLQYLIVNCIWCAGIRGPLHDSRRTRQTVFLQSFIPIFMETIKVIWWSGCNTSPFTQWSLCNNKGYWYFICYFQNIKRFSKNKWPPSFSNKIFIFSLLPCHAIHCTIQAATECEHQKRCHKAKNSLFPFGCTRQPNLSAGGYAAGMTTRCCP